MKQILLISFSYIESDPRVLRQIDALKSHYKIEIVGFPKNNELEIFPIYQELEFSLIRKIKRLKQFVFREYDKYYWDENKKRVLSYFKKKDYDLILANELMALPLALAISDEKTKVYFDAHEYYPGQFENKIKSKLLYQPYISFLSKKYIPKASFFTTVCKSIATEYHNYIGIKPNVINNASPYSKLSPIINDTNIIKLIHHGAAIPSRKLELTIKMMDFLKDNIHLYFMLVPTDPIYLKKLKAISKKNSQITFLPPVRTEEIPSFLNKFDVGLYLLSPTNTNQKYALPNKIFEFIQARLCIVISPNQEMKNIVEDYNLGKVSCDYRPESMAQLINELTQDQIVNFKNNADKVALEQSAEQNAKKNTGTN